MGKGKRAQAPAPAPAAAPEPAPLAHAAPAAAPQTPDRLASLACHARFFDRLVTTIPLRHYTPGDGGRDTRPKSAAERKRGAVAARAAKRARLDPDAAAPSALDLQVEAAAAGGPAAGAPPRRAGVRLEGGATGPPSVDELRGRLQARLERLRGERGADEGKTGGDRRGKKKGKRGAGGDAAKAKAWRDSAVGNAKKGGAKDGKKGVAPALAAAAPPSTTTDDGGRGAAAVVEGDLQFGHVKLPAKREPTAPQRKRPTKAVLLAAAERGAARRDALAAAGDTAALAADAWTTALARAGGEKVLDDPRLLRKSLKKDAALRGKRRDAWAARTAAATDATAARQAKRTANLGARAEGKLAKRKAKREAKLARPGFEGRRGGAPLAAPGPG